MPPGDLVHAYCPASSRAYGSCMLKQPDNAVQRPQRWATINFSFVTKVPARHTEGETIVTIMKAATK